MKPPVRHFIAAIALILAVASGYWIGSGQRHEPVSGSLGSTLPTGTAASQDERPVLYYRNPMGLPDTSPIPKKDSMGMDYIPVYADDTPDDRGVVSVSPARVQLLGVKTAVAEQGPLDAPLRAVGRIELNERSVVDVAPRFEGWVERLHVNAVGDPVRRGQALFTTYSPELQSANEELRIAERLRRESSANGTAGDPMTADAAARLADAARERLRNWEAPAPRDSSGDAAPARQTFHAPANGFVLEKNIVQGSRFMPGDALYRIADLSTVWVIADIFEQDLGRVHVGQSASVSVDAFPGRHFTAKVAYLYPTVSITSRSTALRLELDNRNGALRPGMFAHVELDTGPARARLLVPGSAVIDDGDRQVVLLALDEGRFKPQAVKLGQRGRDDIEILEGLEAGDRVVISANFLIDSESSLRAALANLVSAEAAPSPTYRTRGTFDAYDEAAGTVTLAHEAIPELQWPEMTMEFRLAAPEVAAGFAPGSKIHFTFQAGEPGEYIVTRIEARETSADALPARAASSPDRTPPPASPRPDAHGGH